MLLDIFINNIKYKPRYDEEFEGLKHRENLLIVQDINNQQRNIELFDITDKNKLITPKFIATDIALIEDRSEFIRTINDFSLHIKNDKNSRIN